MPPLHSPSVGAIVPSPSITASREETLRLPLPDPQAGLVDALQEPFHVRHCESPTEIACRGRVGNPLGSQGVEIHLVVAPQFQMLDPRAAGQNVVGDVQHVVRLVIGQMPLRADAGAGRSSSTRPLCRASRCIAPMPPAAKPLRAIRRFVLNVSCRQHRLRAFRPTLRPQPTLNPPLGLVQPILYNGLHSKSSVSGLRGTSSIIP